MYYEEKIINGALMFRLSPDGNWRPVESETAEMVNRLISISDEQRMEVFGYFCKECGAADPICQCWNDE